MQARSAHSTTANTSLAGPELVEQLGPGPWATILFFASPRHDAVQVLQRLEAAHPGACVLGCSTAGEISDRHSGAGGISALGLGSPGVVRCAATLAEYEDGQVERGMASAIADLEAQLGRRLRDLDPTRHVGVVLIEGSFGTEERVNAALGAAAPFLSFVGGSAGDDLTFTVTTCCARGRASHRGCALLALELKDPFAVLKTCHFGPTEHLLVPTRVEGRLVHEFNGEPATVAYARAVGTDPENLTPAVFAANPVGLVIQGQSWLRSPGAVVEGRSMRFFCEVYEGSELRLMRRTGQLLEGTAAALKEIEDRLGGTIGAAVLFNCAYRRLEMDASGLHQPFVDLLRFPAAGFHTHGESWLGHMNQTLTGLVLGRP